MQSHVYRVPRTEVLWQRTPFTSIAGHVGQRIEQTIVADTPAASGFRQQVTDAFELRTRDMHAGFGLSLLARTLNY